MNCVRIVLAALSAIFVVSSSRAADVYFDGGAGGTGTDLASAANWEGDTLPGADDVAIVDWNRGGFTKTFTLSDDLAVKGLRFDNNGDDKSLTGIGTLTIGGEGLTESGSMLIDAPLAAAADQTWTTGNLQIKRGLKMGHAITLKANVLNMIDTASDDAFDVSTGTTLTATGSFFEMNGKTVRVTGGTLVVNNQLLLAPSSGVYYGSEKRSTLEVSAGSVTTKYLFAGVNSQNAPDAIQSVRHTGGTVSANQVVVGGGNCSQTFATYGEYVVNGADAVLDVSSADTSYDYGISLAGNISGSANPKGPLSGAFLQKSGTTKASRVQFGLNYQAFPHWGKSDAGAQGYGYGYWGLFGGVFELGKAGVQLSSKWNAGSVSQAVYRIDFAGGVLKPAAGADMRLAFCVPRSDGPFTWDTGANDNCVSAPVSGEGVLRKAGSGRLTLMDATGFRGKVDVAEGEVFLQGGAAIEPSDDGCLVFTADALKLGDGESVQSWTDAAEGIGMQKPTNFSAPTYVASSSVFNGHAAIRFACSSSDAQGLVFSESDNPLSGYTNATVVLVLNPTTSGLSEYAGDWLWRWNRAVFGTPLWGANEFLLTWMADRRFVFGGGFRDVEDDSSEPKTPSAPVDLNAPHVIVATLRDRQFVLDVDGGVSVTNSYKAVPGKSYPRYTTEQGDRNGVLYLGINTIDGEKSRCFNGEIAELRIYRDRALSDAERSGLIAKLMEKYAPAALPGYESKGYNADLREPEAPVPVAEITSSWSWSAATLTNDLEDGEAVMTWMSDNGQKTATASEGYAPTLIKNGMNGLPTLRFDAARETYMKIVAGQLPFAQPTGDNKGVRPDGNEYYKAMTVAAVFQSSVEGRGSNGKMSDLAYPYMDGVGIISSQKNAGWVHGWSLTWDEGGAVGSSFLINEERFNSPRRPIRLDDGKPHVVIMSRHQETGDYWLMVDGVGRNKNQTFPESWRCVNWTDVWLGALCRQNDATKTGFFTGDISEVKFFDRQLSEDEMAQLTEFWTQKYDVRRMNKAAFGKERLTAFGLSATNINVAAGATFTAPTTKTSPLTLGAGQSLSGAGTFAGSYRFGAGAVIDASGFPGDVEDVQIADGATIVFRPGATPLVCAGISSVSGTVALDVSALEQAGVSRIPLLKVPESAISGATWNLVGAERDAQVVYNERKGMLELKLVRGFLLLVK